MRAQQVSKWPCLPPTFISYIHITYVILYWIWTTTNLKNNNNKRPLTPKSMPPAGKFKCVVKAKFSQGGQLHEDVSALVVRNGKPGEGGPLDGHSLHFMCVRVCVPLAWESAPAMLYGGAFEVAVF